MIEIKKYYYEDLPEEWKNKVPNNGSGKEYASYLCVVKDGKIIETYSDACEPEDAKLTRDFHWVFDIAKRWAEEVTLREALAVQEINYLNIIRKLEKEKEELQNLKNANKG